MLTGAHWLLLPGGPTHRTEGDQLGALWPPNLQLNTIILKGLSFPELSQDYLVTLRGGNTAGNVSKHKKSNDSTLYLYSGFYISILYSSLYPILL